MNELKSLETKKLELQGDIFHSIMMGIDIDSPLTAQFLVVIRDSFVNQKMCSPTDTSILLITIIGDINAQDFASSLKETFREDDSASCFIEMMDRADVIQGTRTGEILSSASLL